MRNSIQTIRHWTDDESDGFCVLSPHGLRITVSRLNTHTHEHKWTFSFASFAIEYGMSSAESEERERERDFCFAAVSANIIIDSLRRRRCRLAHIHTSTLMYRPGIAYFVVNCVERDAHSDNTINYCFFFSIIFRSYLLLLASNSDFQEEFFMYRQRHSNRHRIALRLYVGDVLAIYVHNRAPMLCWCSPSCIQLTVQTKRKKWFYFSISISSFINEDIDFPLPQLSTAFSAYYTYRPYASAAIEKIEDNKKMVSFFSICILSLDMTFYICGNANWVSKDAERPECFWLLLIERIQWHVRRDWWEMSWTFPGVRCRRHWGRCCWSTYSVINYNLQHNQDRQRTTIFVNHILVFDGAIFIETERIVITFIIFLVCACCFCCGIHQRVFNLFFRVVSFVLYIFDCFDFSTFYFVAYWWTEHDQL